MVGDLKDHKLWGSWLIGIIYPIEKGGHFLVELWPDLTNPCRVWFLFLVKTISWALFVYDPHPGLETGNGWERWRCYSSFGWGFWEQEAHSLLHHAISTMLLSLPICFHYMGMGENILITIFKFVFLYSGTLLLWECPTIPPIVGEVQDRKIIYTIPSPYI